MPIGQPVRTISELGDPGVCPEVVHALSSARAVWIDYDALFADFPHLRSQSLSERFSRPGGRELNEMEGKSIAEAWLLTHGAIVSHAQSSQQAVNTPIITSGRKLIAYRPPRYGRALLVSTRDSNRSLSHEDYLRWRDEPEGLLDIKGCGVAPGKTPHLGEHDNGLMFLSQAIEEFVRQRLIERVFRHAGLKVAGVPIYAILDLGIQAHTPGGGTVSAGALIRRAHLRPISGVELPACASESQQIKLEIELVLRQYGITSTNQGTELHVFEGPDGIDCRYAGMVMPQVNRRRLGELVRQIGRPLPWRMGGVNVQHTRDFQIRPFQVELVDFGHYEIARRFERPLLSLTLDRFLNWGGALWPDDSRWIQPDPELAVRYEVAGPRPIPDSLAKNAGIALGTELAAEGILGIELATLASQGELDPADFERAVERYVAEATATWNGSLGFGPVC